MAKNLLLLVFALFFIGTTNAQVTILDFETPTTSTNFQYFGSSLEPNLNNTIANPDVSGINTSSMVGELVKPTGSQSWAGAFANPAIQTPIDLTTDTDICVKVWMPEAGNLALKLELGDQGDWINTIDVSTTQQWVEICFNTLLASEESADVAAGGTYAGLVLFYDFGVANPPADKTMYFDDIIVQAGNTSTSDITFSLDMNDYSGTFTTPYVSGTFNEWSDNANPMEDPDSDGVWTATVTGLAAGSHQYKYQLDEWAAEENFTATSSCTITIDDFTNRALTVTGDETLPTVCYESCYACGASVLITFNVGTSGIIVDPGGLFIAGGGNFDDPGVNMLTDDDMDDIYTITFEKETGFSSYYAFANGNCPDYSCKEDLLGQDCADPNNFNDRFFSAVMNDTIINTCYGVCTETTECGDPPVTYNVTFNVNMNDYANAFTTAYISGTFNGWNGEVNPLDDTDGDGIWSGVITLTEDTYEYKFTLDNWTEEESFMEGDPCTTTNGGFTNRLLDVTSDMEVCYDWNTCNACVIDGLFDLNVDNEMFTLQPTVVKDFTVITFGERYTKEKELMVINALGQVVSNIQLGADIATYELNTSDLDKGLYFVHIQTEGKLQTAKMMISE